MNPIAMAYPTGLRVLAMLRGLYGVPNLADDAMGGLNVGHAMWRARQNWPGSAVLPQMPASNPFASAAPMNPIAESIRNEISGGLPAVTLDDVLRWFPGTP